MGLVDRKSFLRLSSRKKEMLKTIIIERSPLIRKLLMDILKELKISFESFEDPQKALQHLLNHEIHLLIGELQALRGVDMSLLKGVPVIYIMGLLEEVPPGVNWDNVIYKPFRKEEVVEKIKRVLGKEEEEEIIELTDVVEEEAPTGRLSEEELKRVRELINESAKALEDVKKPLKEEDTVTREEETLTDQELGEALRKILKAFARELSKSLAEEIKWALKEGERRDGAS